MISPKGTRESSRGAGSAPARAGGNSGKSRKFRSKRSSQPPASAPHGTRNPRGPERREALASERTLPITGRNSRIVGRLLYECRGILIGGGAGWPAVAGRSHRARL